MAEPGVEAGSGMAAADMNGDEAAEGAADPIRLPVPIPPVLAPVA